jgi:type IV fimbrial biogenesis protein FimT
MLGPMKNHPRGGRARQSAFTLIEAMIVVAVVVVVLVLAAPSFRDLIEMQRLRSTHAQLVTDLQFARAEAVSRQKVAVLKLGGAAGADARTCYTIYTCTDEPSFGNCDCDCTRGVGSACVANDSTQEIRTVVVQGSSGVEIGQPPPPMGATTEVRFDPRTGGIRLILNDDGGLEPWTGAIDTRLVRNAQATLRTMVGLTGRTSACAPLGPVSGYSTACAQN